MNIYIKDSDTKELYASLRNVKIGFYDILHRMLCYSGCVDLCLAKLIRFNCVTIYVNSDGIYYIRDFVRRIIFDARHFYNSRRHSLEVK